MALFNQRIPKRSTLLRNQSLLPRHLHTPHKHLQYLPRTPQPRHIRPMHSSRMRSARRLPRKKNSLRHGLGQDIVVVASGECADEGVTSFCEGVGTPFCHDVVGWTGEDVEWGVVD